MVVHRMYRKLNAEKKGHEKNLKVFWYTGKDQHRPISAAAKKRNCHVKFMAVDEQIGTLLPSVLPVNAKLMDIGCT